MLIQLLCARTSVAAGPVANGKLFKMPARATPPIGRAGPSSVGLCPGPLSEQSRGARPVGDVGDASLAVAVEDSISGHGIGIRAVAADRGGIAGRGNVGDRIQENISDE